MKYISSFIFTLCAITLLVPQNDTFAQYETTQTVSLSNIESVAPSSSNVYIVQEKNLGMKVMIDAGLLSHIAKYIETSKESTFLNTTSVLYLAGLQIVNVILIFMLFLRRNTKKKSLS